MGCCNEPSTVLTPGVQSPSLHVNYAKGMVLGVDDFTQEFTYLSGRDQWMIAELAGYGTTNGLAVFVEDSQDGPRVRVSRGAATVLSGKLVCIPVDQCGLINRWLAKPENAAKINELTHASPPLSPPADHATVSLFLTLCYSDCTTMPVPIPGDPCRSEDELMADSRIADDYKLELRTALPPQTEEDAVRDFAAWLKRVQIVDTGPSPITDEAAWIAALRAAAQPWLDAMQASPPLSPPASLATLGDYMFGSPPLELSIARDQVCDFLRVAFRFWVTELRPLWMTRRCGATPKPDDDCVLLARLEVPILWAGGSPAGAWQVDGGAAAIVVDESRRPYLAHMRLLQEWLACGCACAGEHGAGTATTGGEQIAYVESNATPFTLDATHHLVVGTRNAAQTFRLPKCAPDNRGRVYIVRSTTANSTLTATTGDVIAGVGAPAATAAVNAGNAITVASNGTSVWHIIAVAP